MTPDELSLLRQRLTPRTNKFIPVGLKIRPQITFLLLNDVLEILYGGAAGGGKSEGLLAAAAQYVDVPGYSALILRRSFRDLALPGALMSRSHQWWDQTEAHWDGQNYKWTFPSGATIQFGYLEHENDELRYQSAEFQYVGFDELTQFPEHQYLYLFSRLRRLRSMMDVPIRMRGATNPGGVGHVWVKKRFNLPSGKTGTKDRVFIPAFLSDNPYLDQESYRRGLEELSDLTRAQLLEGDWGVQALGGKFDPAWFTVLPGDEWFDENSRIGVVRHWDLAATEKNEANPDPDWTAGVLLGKYNRLPERIHDRLTHLIREGASFSFPLPPYYGVLNVVRDRKDGGAVEELVKGTAFQDGPQVPISIEQERGASGKILIQTYRENLPGFNVHRLWNQGDKEVRARPVAGRAREGRMFVREGKYVEAFLDELGQFGIKGVHDDQVDGLSGAFIQLDKLEKGNRNEQVYQKYGKKAG